MGEPINGALFPLEIIEVPVFGADEQVATAVAVPIDGRGAGVMSIKLRLGERAAVFEHGQAVFGSSVLEKVGVCAVEQKVDPPVAIPVGRTQFPPPAAAAGLRVEL